MKKTPFYLMAMTVLMVLFASACGQPAAPATQAAAPVAQAPATQAPVANTTAPTQPPVAAPALAPACTGAGSCQAPAFTDKASVDTYCVKKIPYQNLMAPAGTVFEPLPKSSDPKFYPLVCADSGTVVNGLHVFSCHGAELWSYDLKITNPACSASALQAGTTQCAQGQGYDAANKCCSPITTGGAGSVTIKVNMGACPLK
jgi:hypothetical protein